MYSPYVRANRARSAISLSARTYHGRPWRSVCSSRIRTRGPRSAAPAGREPRVRVRVAVDPERVVPVREDLAQHVPVRALAVPALDAGPRRAREEAGAIPLEQRRVPLHLVAELDVAVAADGRVRVEVDGQVQVGPRGQLAVERRLVVDRVRDEVGDAHGHTCTGTRSGSGSAGSGASARAAPAAGGSSGSRRTARSRR